MDKWTESKQTEPGSNSPPPRPQSCSCSSSLFTILCPLPSGRPSSQTHCSWAQLSMFPHTHRPLSGPLYLFGWVVDLPLAPTRGSPFLLASVLNQTVCSLKWPIRYTDWRLQGSCLPSTYPAAWTQSLNKGNSVHLSIYTNCTLISRAKKEVASKCFCSEGCRNE